MASYIEVMRQAVISLTVDADKRATRDDVRKMLAGAAATIRAPKGGFDSMMDGIASGLPSRSRKARTGSTPTPS